MTIFKKAENLNHSDSLENNLKMAKRVNGDLGTLPTGLGTLPPTPSLMISPNSDPEC